jgi:hypothetical protein
VYSNEKIPDETPFQAMIQKVYAQSEKNIVPFSGSDESLRQDIERMILLLLKQHTLEHQSLDFITTRLTHPQPSLKTSAPPIITEYPWKNVPAEVFAKAVLSLCDVSDNDTTIKGVIYFLDTLMALKFLSFDVLERMVATWNKDCDTPLETRDFADRLARYVTEKGRLLAQSIRSKTDSIRYR